MDLSTLGELISITNDPAKLEDLANAYTSPSSNLPKETHAAATREQTRARQLLSLMRTDPQGDGHLTPLQLTIYEKWTNLDRTPTPSTTAATKPRLEDDFSRLHLEDLEAEAETQAQAQDTAPLQADQILAFMKQIGVPVDVHDARDREAAEMLRRWMQEQTDREGVEGSVEEEFWA
ncbi:hypothetical protein CC80DRAFT_489577 [Byssothecium circinans]|uniref:Uncharacterized protein n=1 Tax=Byssothecium circinans TaxID=147558 RepID=A0A6A5U6E1_9PLEO|nr:hypothetical protein CC80DRAFT_489577 [Byssothecium circinans]